MNKKKLWLLIPALTVAVLLGAADCDEDSGDAASNKAKADRAADAAATVKCGAAGESLECKNLAKRKERESDPNKIVYVYLYNFDGTIKGYFTAKGKVSSNQSQMGPTDTVIIHDRGTYGNTSSTVEAPADDGSYGEDAPGIFFFTTNDTMVTFSGDYVTSDRPLPFKVKNLETQSD